MKNLFTKLSLFSTIAALLLLNACHKCHDADPSTNPVSASWAKITSLPANEKFILLETFSNTIYAASASGIIYTSINLGLTWSSSTIVKQGTNITTLSVFNNVIYVGTSSDGIFGSIDNGRNWVKQANIQQISSFTSWNNNLYASSADGTSPSDGIMVLNETTGTWRTFNSNGLPSNYDFDVNKTIVINQTLASIRGVNGYFYGYGNASNQWIGIRYFPNYQGGMQDVIYDKGVILVSSGRQLLSSNNFANTWSYDTVGLTKENAAFLSKTRILYAANNKFYVVSNLPSGGSWIQQRDEQLSSGSTWANNQEFLPHQGFSYAILALNNVIFLATDDGLYYKKAS